MAQIKKFLNEYIFTHAEDADEKGNTVLHLTMMDDKLTQQEMIKILGMFLSGGVNLDIKNHNNETILELAISRRMKDVVNFLLEHTTDIKSATHFFIGNEYKKVCELLSQPEIDSETLQRMETEAVGFTEWLVSQGLDFDWKNEEKVSAVVMAIDYNLQYILPVLLKHTNDINSVDETNKTLLHLFLEKKTNHGSVDKIWCSKRYEIEILKILLHRGVSVDAEDNLKRTPIRIAIENAKAVDLIEMLLEHSNNVHHKNAVGETVFYMVIKEWICSNERDADYYMRIARALMTKGANVNEPNMYGKTPLGYAIEKHNLPIVEFLLKNGANFSMITMDGDTLMHLLGSNDNDKTEDEAKIKLFDLLISKNCSVSVQNKAGMTPLEVAANTGNTTIVRKLLEHGVDVNCRNNKKETPLFYAVRKHNLEMVKVLEEYGADFSMTNEDGESLMHLLVKSKCNKANSKWFHMLVDKGCQVNVKDKTGTTPLHYAAMHSNCEVVRILIKHDVPVNCRNNQMETPLHFSTTNPKVGVVGELLLKHGANANAKDSKGQTPLHKIALEPRTEYSRIGLALLLSHGADVNARNLQNLSVLSCARFRDLDDWQRQRKAWVDEQNESLRQRAEQNDDGNDDDLQPLMTINDCPIQDMATDLVIDLTAHSMKLKAAGLPWDEQINGSLGHFVRINANAAFYELYNEKCTMEIKGLKSTFIDNRTSLYDFLKMDLNRKRVYVNNEKLQKLIRSPLKLHRYTFPEYSMLILASYNEALIRKTLLEPARKAWLELTKINLPAICLDIIFSFLSNADLFLMIDNDDTKLGNANL